jgi:hypothetical protein
MSKPTRDIERVKRICAGPSTACVKLSKSLKDVPDGGIHGNRLLMEVERLTDVINELVTGCEIDTDVNFDALEVPLEACEDICTEIQEQLEDVKSNSSDKTARLQEWTLESNVKDRLASYRSMIQVTLRVAAV